MKIWKLISLLLLTAFIGACDDDEKWSDNENGGNAGAEASVEARFGFEAKTVLKNAGQVLVPVKLAKPVNHAVKVTVAAEKGSGETDAREGIDFNLPEKVVTVPAGDTVAYLTVDLLDDGKTDNERVVKLNMTGVYGGKTGALKSVLLHIVSNAFVEFEKAKWETWESANVETSSEEVRMSRFVPLTITGELTEPVTIVFEVTDSSAIEPTHFSVEKELTVNPGDTKVSVEVKPVDDVEVNDDRIFNLSIKEIKGGNLLIGKTNPTCEVKILSEEILRLLSWEKTSQEVTDEEVIISVPVSLDKTPLATFTVNIAAADESDAVAGVDYELLTSQISIDASRQATVQVKVLNNREVNADRTLVLKFDEISDNTIFVRDNAKAFTLNIKNSDFPVFVGGGEAVEDETVYIDLSIPAVNKDRVITLAYSSTETVAGTYFTFPSEQITVSAGAESVQVPVQVGYTTGFPTVAPEFTVSIVKVGDYVLEEAVNTTWVLTPCDYRKLLGTWHLTSSNPEAMNASDIVVSAGENGEFFNEKYVCKVSNLSKNFSKDLQWNMSYEKESGDIKLIMKEKINVEEHVQAGTLVYLVWDYFSDPSVTFIETSWVDDNTLSWNSGGNYVCVGYYSVANNSRIGQYAWHLNNVRMIRQ